MPISKRGFSKLRYKNRRSAAARTIQRSYRKYKNTQHRRKKAFDTKPVILRVVRPERVLCKLFYNSATKSMIASDTLAGSTTQQYRVNGAYDPNTAVGGEKCRNFQFLANMYKRYRVRSATINTYTSQVPSGARPATIYVTPHVSTFTLPSTTPNLREMPETRLSTIKADGTQNQCRSMVNVAAIYGVSKRQVSDDDGFSSAYNGVPSLQAYWSVSCVKKDLTAAQNVTISLNVQIVYWIEFYQPYENEI